MADEQVVTLEAPVTTQQADPFGASWTEEPTEVKLETTAAPTNDTPTTAVPDTPAITPTPAASEDEIIEPKEWLKREFGVEDAALLKAEREELKRLKEQSPAEIKFADDQSKQIYELLREGGDKKKAVRQFLETQERIETLVTSEVSKETADDIIKLSMQLKYKDLTPKEIEYKFNKEFSLPKEPVQTDELDEELGTEMDVEAGDIIYFHYLAISNCIRDKKYVICKGIPYFVVSYLSLFCTKRKVAIKVELKSKEILDIYSNTGNLVSTATLPLETIIPLNNFVMVEPLEVAQEEKNEWGFYLPQKATASNKNIGIVRYINPKVKNLVEVGDKIFFAKNSWAPLQYDLHNSVEGNKTFYRMTNDTILAKLV